MLAIARFEKAKTHFRLAFLAMLAGAVFTGIGLAFLLYGVSDQGAADKVAAEVAKTKAETRKTDAEAAKTEAELPAAGESAPSTTVALPEGTQPATLVLNNAGFTELRSSLGPQCSAESIPAMLIGFNSGTGIWDVLTLPAGDCKSARIKFDTKFGRLETR